MNPTNVSAEAQLLLEKAQGSSAGRAAHMVVGGPQTEMTQTLIALTYQTRLDDHENPGEATILVLEGEVELGTAEESWDAGKGDMLAIPDSRHHLIAKTDAVILLTSVKLG
ncbi:MAG: cupin domain-containing protein [Aeromicrobium sp.]